MFISVSPPQRYSRYVRRCWYSKSSNNKGTTISEYYPTSETCILLEYSTRQCKACTEVEQIHVWSDMVSPLKAHLSDDNSRILPAIERIEKMSGSASIKNVAQFQGISVRHLETRIKNQTGLTPKLLSRTIRLQNILKHLFLGIPDTLTHLAFSNGYADQPHFNKDFKALTGRLPTFFMQPDRDDATLTYIRDMHEKHNGIHIFHQL